MVLLENAKKVRKKCVTELRKSENPLKNARFLTPKLKLRKTDARLIYSAKNEFFRA